MNRAKSPGLWPGIVRVKRFLYLGCRPASHTLLCRLGLITLLLSLDHSQLIMNFLHPRAGFRDVFGQSVYRSWAALLAIMAALFAALVVLQKRKDAT